MLIGAIASPVTMKYLFIAGSLVVIASVLRVNFFEGASKALEVGGNVLACLTVGFALFGLWHVIPQPKEPPTPEEIADEISKKMVLPQRPAQATSKPEPTKSPTASEIADMVVAQIRKSQISQGTHDLRQKEYELATHIRKVESDHEVAAQAIDDSCIGLGRSRGFSCGVSQRHDEQLAHDRAQSDYRAQAAILNEEMLAKLPPQSRPQKKMDEVGGVDLADYLDRMAAQLP